MKNGPKGGKERRGVVVLFRSILFLFLLFSSAAILYGTAVNTRAVRDLAENAMESTALALSTSAESALRSGGKRAEGEVRNILSDRVVAYAMVARKDGTIVLHTNPGMVATFTDNAGGPAMMIGQKRGGTFHTDGSDMNGTWRFQRLTAGGDNTTSGWANGTMEIVLGTAGISAMNTNVGLVGGGVFAFSMDGNGTCPRHGTPRSTASCRWTSR